MRTFIPITLLALLCLALACKKEVKPTLNRQIAHLQTGTCDIQNFESTFLGPTYYKTYHPDGRVDSLYLTNFTYRPWDFAVRVKYDGNHIYLVEYPADTLYTIELNSQGKVHSTKWATKGGWDFLPAIFHYNSAGQLTDLIRNYEDSYSEALQIEYDSLNNVRRISNAWFPDANITFTYDYSTPITAADYVTEPSYVIGMDLMICQKLNLVDVKSHFKVTRAIGTFYPEFDRTYSDQIIDSLGRVVSYHTTGFDSDEEMYLTAAFHCQ